MQAKVEVIAPPVRVAPPVRDDRITEEWLRYRKNAVLAADEMRKQRAMHTPEGRAEANRIRYMGPSIAYMGPSIANRNGPSIDQLDAMLDRLGYNSKVNR